MRKVHPKPWQTTTRDGFGEASDHWLSMAMTAGSTSATAGVPIVTNATSTIAKQRTPTSVTGIPVMNLLGNQGMGKVHAAGGTEFVAFWVGVTYLLCARLRGGSPLFARETAETLRTSLGRPV